MRELSRSALNNYTDSLNEVVDRGTKELVRQLRAVDYSRPVEEWRSQVVRVMDACCGGASQMAAHESAIFYDGLRERVVGSALGAFAQDQRNPTATEKAVRAFLAKLLDEDDYDAFEQLCCDRLDYEVKRAAGRCTQYNVSRDPYEDGVRYARVPTGLETCDFCIMLASRGPVYHTAESAGAMDHYHKGCDCRVVPFWGTYELGPSRRASALMGVEGYDPDALYEQYVDRMLDPKFRDRMARGADHARGRNRNGTARETSHPQLWAQAIRDGKVRFKSVGEVTNYIRDASSYEDLFDRIKEINKELPYYGLSSNYIDDLQRVLRNKRNEFVS